MTSLQALQRMAARLLDQERAAAVGRALRAMQSPERDRLASDLCAIPAGLPEVVAERLRALA